MKEIMEFFKGCETSAEKLSLAVVMVLLFVVLPVSVASFGWLAVVLAVGYEVAAFWMLVHYVSKANELEAHAIYRMADLVEKQVMANKSKKEDAA